MTLRHPPQGLFVDSCLEICPSIPESYLLSAWMIMTGWQEGWPKGKLSSPLGIDISWEWVNGEHIIQILHGG